MAVQFHTGPWALTISCHTKRPKKGRQISAIRSAGSPYYLFVHPDNSNFPLYSTLGPCVSESRGVTPTSRPLLCTVGVGEALCLTELQRDVLTPWGAKPTLLVCSHWRPPSHFPTNLAIRPFECRQLGRRRQLSNLSAATALYSLLNN